MTKLVEVAQVDDFKPGERRFITADGKPIGVFNIEGDYYAILNTCAHEAGPVCEGKLQGALVGEYSEPGERIKEEFSDTPAIACPWHGWEYDLTTGNHLGDSEISLPAYEVVIKKERVYVEL